MQQYCAYGVIDKIERYGKGGTVVYLALDVDARIAELEKALKSCAFELGKLVLATGDFDNQSAAQVIDEAHRLLMGLKHA